MTDKIEKILKELNIIYYKYNIDTHIIKIINTEIGTTLYTRELFNIIEKLENEQIKYTIKNGIDITIEL